MLSQGAARLQQGRRVLLETEEVSHGVLASLQRQRAQLAEARAATAETGEEVSASKRSLRSLWLHAVCRSSAYWLLGLLLVGTLALLFYGRLERLGLVHKPVYHHHPPPPRVPPPPRTLLRGSSPPPVTAAK